VGNDNIGVGNKTATRKPSQQMAGAMSQQGGYVMGDNQCTQQKLLRLVGCRDPKANLKANVKADLNKAGLEPTTPQFGQGKR
jgi:hypothetical protein